MRERRLTGLSVLMLLAPLASCAPAGPKPISLGSSCAACGMAILDLRFACERGGAGDWRQYDAIECLLGDRNGPGAIWLADYDSRTLTRSESSWVVSGEFPSPMGGGLAAFVTRAAAEEVASRTRGRVARLEEFAGEHRR